MSYLPELRASLVRAAEREAGAAPAPRRRAGGWFGVTAAVGVAVAVVAVAVVLVGRAPPRTTVPSGSGVSASWPKVPAPPPNPNPSVTQSTLIDKAQNDTVAHDPACRPMRHLPAFSPGSPGPALTSLLGVLRRPRTPADAFPIEVFGHGPGGVQVAAIRLARTDDATSLYIVPLAGLGFRPVPARCGAEERAALVSRMKGSPRNARRATLEVLAQTVAWQQYEGRHPESVCLAEAYHKPPTSRRLTGEGLSCGWGVAEIERGQAGLGSEGTESASPRFTGIVPDGVASVTLEFPRQRRNVNGNVVGNAFAVRLPRGVGGTPSAIVWRAADASVIKTTRVP